MSLSRTGAIGAIGWHHTALAVDELEPSIAFFEAVFGYETLFISRGMSDQIASITGRPGLTCDLAQLRNGLSDHRLELVAFREPTPAAGARSFAPGGSHVAFLVSDIAAAIETVTRHGAVQIGRITEFSDGLAVYCVAPGGALFELEQPPAPDQGATG